MGKIFSIQYLRKCADDYKKGGEKMIISASRRTDIPTYYSEWLFNRLKEEYVLVRNPMNIHQIGQISLSPDAVDGIVFGQRIRFRCFIVFQNLTNIITTFNLH